MRELTLSIALILFSASVLSGQSQESLRVLTLPEGQPILCRVLERDSTQPLPPQVVAREFRFGNPDEMHAVWPREISVGFDSLGRTLFISDERDFGLKGNETVFAILDSANVLVGQRMDFGVDSTAFERAMRNGDIAGARAAHRPPVTRPLTSEESEHLSALAGWLWKRRCPPR